MEEGSPVKLSVAELAGKFKSHPLPMPKTDERKPVRRSPPCFLQFHDQMDRECEKEVRIERRYRSLVCEQPVNKLSITPQPPPKTKMKNSPLIEKLQANPILSPTILFNSAKSPEGKQQATPFCPIRLCSRQISNLRPPQQHADNEVPISFEQPAEGTPLPNFNKSRVRLSFKRRPPTRQHRKSTGEEGVADTPEENRSPCDLHSPGNTPDKNGNAKDALNVPQEETHKSQEDSSTSITVQDTELQDEQNDVSKNNEGTEDTDGGSKEELAEEKSSGNPEASEAMDKQQATRALGLSTGEKEGFKKTKETSGDSTEENMDGEDQDQDQDQASGD